MSEQKSHKTALDKWMTQRGVSNRGFAAMLGDRGVDVNKTTVSRIRRGIFRPDPGHMAGIFDATDGAVDANDLFLSEALVRRVRARKKSGKN